MQLTALFPVLALLATSELTAARTAHPNAAAAKRHLAQHAKHISRDEVAANHARAAEAIASNLKRKDQLAAENPRAVRKVKRASNACRTRGSSFTPSAASTSTAAATSTTAAAAVVSSAAAAVESSAAPAASSSAASDDNNNVAAAAWWAPSSTAASSAAPAATSAASSSSSSTSSGGLTPNGIKAGASGTDTLDAFGSHISWFWNYGPTSDTSSSLIFMPTLWGDGQSGESQDWSRLQAFEAINWTPQYVQGFYEPDCSPPMSSAIDPYTAAPLWNSLIVPFRAKGSLLVSPGMCKQADEDWLTPFLNTIGAGNEWDITSIHINKVDMAGVQKDIDHYWNTYGKPIWVTEFACVDDTNGFTPCTDQGQINSYINQIVDLFEGDSRIYAYSMSEGEGLGSVWPPWSNGALTESGQTYLNAISKYH